jgi:hypothetical protein
MLTLGGEWSNSHQPSGRCFNGTYCAVQQTTIPTLLADPCPDAHYCPTATPAPLECPAGTYNPHTGQDELEDCTVTPAGYYTTIAVNVLTGPCNPGHYCPAGSTSPDEIPCPERFYRTSTGAASSDECALCTSGSYCPAGSVTPLECPRGYYCITGIANPEPCRLGTYGNSTSLRRIEDCTPCTPGYFCDGKSPKQTPNPRQPQH